MTRMELLQATLRTLTSLMVAVAFLLFLVVASAQQQAVASLREAKVEVSYSVARKVLGEVDGYKTSLIEARRTLGEVGLDERQVLAPLVRPLILAHGPDAGRSRHLCAPTLDRRQLAGVARWPTRRWR